MKIYPPDQTYPTTASAVIANLEAVILNLGTKFDTSLFVPEASDPPPSGSVKFDETDPHQPAPPACTDHTLFSLDAPILSQPPTEPSAPAGETATWRELRETKLWLAREM